MDTPAKTLFPLEARELKPDLLSRVLNEQYPAVRVKALSIVDSSVYGNGSTSTADRVVLDLVYSANDADLPKRMLLKTMLIEAHVPLTMYENEVLFYRQIRPELQIEAPKVFGASFDGASGRFGILMEDLNARDAQFKQATQSLSLKQMHSALDTMADLHAKYWASPRLCEDWRWLPTVTNGGMADVFKQEFWFQHVASCVAATPVKEQCIIDLNCTLEDVWRALWKVNEGALSSGPRTLLHGDLHMANIYVLPDDSVGLLDWQLASRGCWAQDFSYLMATALETQARNTHQRELLIYYLEGLRQRGVLDAPPIDEAWNLYRQGVIWGFAIGWLGCPVENYGIEVTSANLMRLCGAMRDLETPDAIRTLS